MSTKSKKLIASAGFIYGLILAFYAVSWGVDGPTLTMPLAASPLNVPAAFLDQNLDAFSFLMPLLPVLIVVSLIAAPFGWAAIAVLVASAEEKRRRTALAAVFLAHYLGIAAWFAIMGKHYLLRPFRILVWEGTLLLVFYAAGQIVLWWALLRKKTRSFAVPV